MTTVLLVRHGRTGANARGRLAGWTPGVCLDERGEEQARGLAERIAKLPVAAVVSSPLERCVQTANVIAAVYEGLDVVTDERLAECRYGDWTGKELKALAEEDLWEVVQQHPSAAVFPGGEALRDVQFRAVAAVRDWNDRIAAEHGPDALYVLCTHGDVVKAVVADALGMHLDMFQRITVDPCSLTVIRYTPLRPFLLRLNDTGGEVDGLLPPPPDQKPANASDAVVGGGAGAP